ncbi:MAG: hypothetical protein P4M09_22945 [Devosia sp.]|nr:hypothetical protein [Devosia sp.]
MGWTTDTLRLQQAGWSISAEQDVSRMEMMLAMRHPHAASYGISSRVDWRYMEDMDRFSGFAPMRLGADIRFGRNIEVMHHGPVAPYSFQAVDAQPELMTTRRTHIEDFAHFAPSPLARTNPIVVPEENVQELMDRILKLQQPDRTDRIRAALRNPEGYMIDSLPKQTFHAQIISFAA